METLLQDIRYGVRRLFKSPGFTLVATLTLAMGIGANSAIFSVVNAVLLRPLPYEDAERLVRVFTTTREGGQTVLSVPNFLDAREQNGVLEEMSFFAWSEFTLTGRGDAVQLNAALVGSNYFQVLRVQPAVGRLFLPEENEPGRHRVAILSHALWSQRFGADPAIVGRIVTLDSRPYEVVGVMPAGFSYPAERDVWAPMAYDAPVVGEGNRGGYFINVIGRLEPGVTVEQAARELQAIGERLEEEHPATNTGFGLTVVSLRESMVGEIRTALLVLLGAVFMVLLIACANLANLMLARATTREGELALRTALGAGRGRLIRQLLTESILLGLLGGAGGLLLAVWGTSLLVHLQPQGIPRIQDVSVDATVVAFTTGVALLTGLLFGLIPAVQVTRSGLVGSLKEGGRGALPGTGGSRVRRILVVTEMALAVMLLAGAGLLVRSFVRLQGVDPGFRPHGVLTYRLALPEADFDSDPERATFYAQLMERMRALPGVETVGGVSALPMSGRVMTFGFEVEGREPPAPGSEPVATILVATPDYFSTLQIPLARGRLFSEQDRQGTEPVLLISEETAHRFFADEDPIGKRLNVSWGRDAGAVRGTVVGVVRDLRQLGLDKEEGPILFLPHSQVSVGSMSIVMRTAVPPMSLAAAVKREVAALNSSVPLTDLRPLHELVAGSISQPRFYMLLLSIFAGVALLLAAIGIFGVISYSVTQRTREIGIRIALGADPSNVMQMVVGGAMGLAGAGVVLGIAGALAGARLLSGLLYGVGTTDPLTYLCVGSLLVGVALAASFIPARAAIRVDPNVALRYE